MRNHSWLAKAVANTYSTDSHTQTDIYTEKTHINIIDMRVLQTQQFLFIVFLFVPRVSIVVCLFVAVDIHLLPYVILALKVHACVYNME